MNINVQNLLQLKRSLMSNLLIHRLQDTLLYLQSKLKIYSIQLLLQAQTLIRLKHLYRVILIRLLDLNSLPATDFQMMALAVFVMPGRKMALSLPLVKSQQPRSMSVLTNHTQRKSITVLLLVRHAWKK